MASVSPASAPVRARVPGRSALRVGVFADSPMQPRWLVESLARVAAGEFAQIVVLSTPAKAGAPGFSLWHAYGRIDRWVFGNGPDPLKPMALAPLVAPERRMTWAPSDPQWRARIEDLRLDVAFVVGDLEDSSLDGLSTYGVWRHCFGESDCEPGLAALNELVEEKDVVLSGLRIRRADASRLACRSWSRTVPFSLARSHDRLFARAAEFLPRALKQLHEHGDEWLEREGVADEMPGIARRPGLGDALRGIGTLGARVARRTLEHCFTVGQWSLAYRFTPLERWEASLQGFHRLVPPPDRFWADPFPLEVNGRHYIFFEELPFDTGKGHISVVEVRRDGKASAPVRVLERDYHLSYPFLVQHGGALFMIPESAQNRTIEAWRCVEFPAKWRRERVLLDGGFFADATFHREPDRWWMFANSGSPEGGADDELHVFSARDLFGDWQPHRRNPVKCDVRSSRPAGNLFREGPALYRPGQVCAPIYGAGVVLHRVGRLDDLEYAEVEERRIVPMGAPRAPGAEPILGLHTINRAGELSVTDAFVRRRRF